MSDKIKYESNKERHFDLMFKNDSVVEVEHKQSGVLFKEIIKVDGVIRHMLVVNPYGSKYWEFK